jgi:hypothetical protein
MVEFLSDPFCVICEQELSGVLICFNKTYCEKHEVEMENFRQSEFYQELTRLFEEDGEVV